MATVYIKKCPICGHVLHREDVGGIRYYGNPFKECKKCHAVLFDKDVFELALEGRGIVKLRKVRSTPIACIVAGLIMGILSLFTGPADEMFAVLRIAAVLSFVLGAAWAIIDYRSYPKREKKLEMEYLESQARMSDPAYRMKLVQYGYRTLRGVELAAILPPYCSNGSSLEKGE